MKGYDEDYRQIDVVDKIDSILNPINPSTGGSLVETADTRNARIKRDLTRLVSDVQARAGGTLEEREIQLENERRRTQELQNKLDAQSPEILAAKDKTIADLEADKARLAPSYLAKELEAANKKAADLEAAGKVKDDKLNLKDLQLAAKAPVEYQGVIASFQAQLTAAQAKADEPALKAQAAANDAAKKEIEAKEKAIKAFHEAQAKGEDGVKSFVETANAAKIKELDEQKAALDKAGAEMRAREKTFHPDLQKRTAELDAREAKVSQRESAIGVRESAAGQQLGSAKSREEAASQSIRMYNAKAEAADAERTKFSKLSGELLAGNISPEEAQRAKRELEREEEEKTRRQQYQAASLDKKKDASQQGIGKALMAGGVIIAAAAAIFVAVTVMTGGASLAALPSIMAMAGGGAGLATAAFGYRQYRAEKGESLQAGKYLSHLNFEQKQNKDSLNERAVFSARAANRSYDATGISKDQAPAVGGKTQVMGRNG